MNPLFDKPFTFDRVMRIFFGLVIATGIIYLIAVLRNALLPFLIAWLLAYMMQPFVRFFQYKLHFKFRIISILAVIISTIAILAGLAALIVPSVTEEASRMMDLIQKYNGYNRIPFIPNSWVVYIEHNFDPDRLMRMLSKENLNDLVKEVFPQVWSLLTNTFSIIFSIAIVFVIMLYFIFILLDYEKIADGWINLIPKKYRHFVKGLSEDVEYSMNRYFRGQSLIALCVGILLAIGFKIIDFPLAILLGLFIGVLNLIPYMQTIGFIPMILLSLIKSTETGQNFWIIFGLSVVVLCIVQCIQDLILTPKIMGKAMGLNPAIILLSLSIWGTLLGFIGLIIALPMTTLCLSYYKRFILMEDEEEKKEQAELMEEEAGKADPKSKKVKEKK